MGDRVRFQVAATSKAKICTTSNARSMNLILRKSGFRSRSESTGSRSSERRRSKSKSLTA